MGRILRGWMRQWSARRHRRQVERALALHGRGEVRPDGLRLDALCTRLEIQWTARDIHPWDRNLPVARQQRLFAEQALTDTEAVIARCFEALPAVDSIDLAVAERASGEVLLSGTVERVAWERGRPLASIRMRLRELGVIPMGSADAVR